MAGQPQSEDSDPKRRTQISAQTPYIRAQLSCSAPAEFEMRFSPGRRKRRRINVAVQTRGAGRLSNAPFIQGQSISREETQCMGEKTVGVTRPDDQRNSDRLVESCESLC